MRNLITLFFLILMFCQNLKSQDAVDVTRELRHSLEAFHKRYEKAGLNSLTLCANLARKIYDEKKLSPYIKSLVEDGAVIDNPASFSAVHFAAQAGDEPLLAFLVEKKADINAIALLGWTPLMHAARNNQARMCCTLLRLGASLTIRDRNGCTTLMGACGDTIEVLVNAGVDVNDVDNNDLTPLIHAVKNQDGDAIKRLIKLGADINYRQADGETVLQSACNVDPCIAMTLIGAGANFKKNFYRGKNPDVVQKIMSSSHQLEWLLKDRTIQYALERKLGDLIDIRLDQLAYKNPFEHHLYTAIRVCYHALLNEILCNLKTKNRLLLLINSMNSYDTTPLFFALIMENSEAIELLLSYGASAMVGPDVFAFLEQKFTDNPEKKSQVRKKLCESCRDYGIVCILALRGTSFPNDIITLIINFVFDDKNKILGKKWLLKKE